MTPTLIAMQKASEVMAKISPTYLQAINFASKVVNSVDISRLAMLTNFAFKLKPVAIVVQSFLDNMSNVEPAIAEKIFEVLSNQNLDDETNLPLEAPQETGDLIMILKRNGREVINLVADFVLNLNVMTGIFPHKFWQDIRNYRRCV